MKKNCGFSLVEALVAIFIIVILLVFVMNVFPFVYKGLQLSENHTSAAFLGRSLLEKARRTAFDEILPYSGSKTFETIKNGKKIKLKMDYEVKVNIMAEDKKAVWAVVSWNENRGKKKVVLETIIVRK